METGEWRYGQADDDRPPGGRSPGGPRSSGDADAGSTAAGQTPNLWAEDPTTAWGSTPSWEPPEPRSQPDRGWEPPEPPEGAGQARHAAPAGTAAARQASPYPAPQTTSYPLYPAPQAGPYPAPPYSPAAPFPGRYPPEVAATLHPVSASPAGSSPPPEHRPAGPDERVRSGAHRSPVTETQQYGPRRGADYPDQPAYLPAFGYTAGWYAVPAVLHLIWLLTLEGDRQALAWRTFVTSLPWLLGALVLSLIIAGVLRWAIIEWRAMTISFAAAVVGAGVTTIIYSLTI